MTTEPTPVSRFERAKLLHDYFKYLATLGTGSVAFLVTFSEKFAGEKGSLLWFAAALISFMVCVISSVAAQTSYIWYATSPESRYGTKGMYLLGLWGRWIGLLGGVMCLVVFALDRLF